MQLQKITRLGARRRRSEFCAERAVFRAELHGRQVKDVRPPKLRFRSRRSCSFCRHSNAFIAPLQIGLRSISTRFSPYFQNEPADAGPGPMPRKAFWRPSFQTYMTRSCAQRSARLSYSRRANMTDLDRAHKRGKPGFNHLFTLGPKPRLYSRGDPIQIMPLRDKRVFRPCPAADKAGARLRALRRRPQNLSLA